MFNNNVGYHYGRVDTKSNVIADGISCIPFECSLSFHFPCLLLQAPSLNGYHHYQPNVKLVLLIMVAFLQTASMDPLTTSRLLLTDPGRFLSFPGATQSG